MPLNKETKPTKLFVAQLEPLNGLRVRLELLVIEMKCYYTHTAVLWNYKLIIRWSKVSCPKNPFFKGVDSNIPAEDTALIS